MPPNLGGFFMVRSYYPSECHADYFDFERIEALKPAIEACGISTLSQSPMLGFHKQMDNRIKLDRKSGSGNAETDLSAPSLHDALPIYALPIVCFHASKSWRLFYGSFLLPF